MTVDPLLRQQRIAVGADKHLPAAVALHSGYKRSQLCHNSRIQRQLRFLQQEE